MGCCSPRRRTKRKLKEVLVRFKESAQPQQFEILAELLRQKNMFPDSMIYPEQIKDQKTITSSPRPAIDTEAKSHGASNRQLEEIDNVSISDDMSKTSLDLMIPKHQKQTTTMPNDEIKGLNTELKSKNENLCKAQRTIGHLENKLSELREEKQQDHDKMEMEIAALKLEKQRDHEILRRKLAEPHRTIQQDDKELTKQLTELQQEKQRDHDKLTEGLSELQQEKQRNHNKLTEELTKLQQEKQRDHDKLTEELTKQQQEKQRDHDKLTEELTELQQEKQRDHEKLSEELTASKEEKRDVQMKLDEKIRILEKELEDTSSKVKKLQDHQGQLQSALARRDKHIVSMEEDMNSKTTELQRKEAGQKSRYSELNLEIRKMEDENETLSANIETLQLENKDLKSNLGEKKKEVQDYCERNDTLSRNFDYLHSKHNSMQEELGGRIEKLKEDNKKQISSIQELQDDKERLVDQLGATKDELKTLQSNKDQLTQKLETEQQDHHNTSTDLGEQIASLRENNAGLSSTVEKLQRNVSVFEKQFGVSEDELKTLRLNKDHLTQELETEQRKHHTARTDLGEQIASLRGDNAGLSSTIEKIQRNVGVLERQFGVKEEELKTLQSNKDQLTSELETEQRKHHTTRNDLGEQIASLRGDNAGLTSTVETLKLNVAAVERQHNSVQETLRTANIEKQTLEKEITSLRDEKQELHRDMLAKLEDLRAENTELASNIEVLQQEKETLQQKFDAKDDELQTIQREQREAAERARRKSVVLSIRSEKSGMGKAMVDMITKEITKGLDSKVDKSYMDLTIQPQQASAGALGGPLVVLCLNMSRIGTNILDTLKGIKVDKDVIALVLHHTSKENLSSLTPTSLRVTGSELRQLGAIIDMAFDSHSGLYACELNTTAIEKLAIILKKY